MPRHSEKPRPPLTPAYTEREARSQRRTAVRNPAMTRVLATPELLECVLLHLDMRTLLVSAQRACRVWHELIATSPALQEALFFKPDDVCGTGRAKTKRRKGQGNDVTLPTDETADGNDDDEEQKNVVVRKNPLPASVFPAWFEDYTVPPLQRHEVVFNYGWRKRRVGHSAVLSSVSRIPARDEFASQPFAAAADRVLRYRRASWRRMLTQQPPARHVGEWRLLVGMEGAKHEASMRFFSAGLRIGRLYDMTSEAVAGRRYDRPTETVGWPAYKGIQNVLQCVLWGPEGVRRVQNGYPGRGRYPPPEPHRDSRESVLGLNGYAPRERKGKEILDGLAAAADVTILVHDNGFHYDIREEDEFCLNFICGAHKHQHIGKSWQEQPKGREIWKWQKRI